MFIHHINLNYELYSDIKYDLFKAKLNDRENYN